MTNSTFANFFKDDDFDLNNIENNIVDEKIKQKVPIRNNETGTGLQREIAEIYLK